MTITDVFHQRLRGENAGHLDIIEHLALLHYLAGFCPRVTEFGTRTGNSTIAFLAAGSRVTSYDIAPPQFVLEVPEAVARWRFHLADTATLGEIASTDLLFVDTLHTYAQVKAELKHAAQVSRFLVFHDTVLNGFDGENGEPGIVAAINEFMAANPGVWSVLCHMQNCNGLLVLERVE